MLAFAIRRAPCLCALLLLGALWDTPLALVGESAVTDHLLLSGVEGLAWAGPHAWLLQLSERCHLALVAVSLAHLVAPARVQVHTATAQAACLLTVLATSTCAAASLGQQLFTAQLLWPQVELVPVLVLVVGAGAVRTVADRRARRERVERRG